MQDKLRTFKGRAILLMAFFALVITLIVSVVSFNIIAAFQRKTAVQSVEFNLRLVASIIEQDLRDLTALGVWCGMNDQIAEYLTAFGTNVTRLSMEAYYRLLEEFNNNRAGRYVRRLIVFDTVRKKILQVGNATSTSSPVNRYNVGRVLESGISLFPYGELVWQAPVADSFMFLGEPMILPFAAPVYHPRNGSEIGVVFLAANINIITDKLTGYSPAEHSELYILFGTACYRIKEGRFIPADLPERKKGYITVSHPVRDEITMIQILPDIHFLPQEGAWPVLAAGLLTLILLLTMMGFGINRMIHEITVLMEKRIDDEKKQRYQEYRMLQSQINPHFMYNTLNSIKWMAVMQHVSGIPEMITALSRLLQTLSKDQRKLVPLRDELALLDDYMVIQKYRYGDSVTMEKNIENETLLDTAIPRFSLQPLVENAVFHGVEPKGGGIIKVRVAADNDVVLVSIRDDGVGMKEELIDKLHGDDSSGMFRKLGIYNVDERLRYTFGQGYGLSIESEEGQYTIMTITLPRHRGLNG
jgi:two-component system sensor histidine kinase YesM